MEFVDLNRYRKELIDTADIICSFLNEEEKKALETTIEEERISFRDQIVVTYYKKYPMHPTEKIKELSEELIKNFKPFFKLKDDDCGINKILLDRLDNLIFESEKGYWKEVQQQLEEAVLRSK